MGNIGKEIKIIEFEDFPEEDPVTEPAPAAEPAAEPAPQAEPVPA